MSSACLEQLVWLITGLMRKGQLQLDYQLLELEKSIFVVGPEYVAIGLTAAISAVTGGGWAASKILSRHSDQVQQAFNYIGSQKRRIDVLEEDLKRLPMDYVLKVDFLREIQDMHDNFREINNKLDKLIEKMLSSK